MSQFFISCKESRIENNRSFYGCFYLGPFEPSQSITIANALRRTLLSELYGCGIVSVEIEGATHEYSSLPGVRDSVLDILLNLKEIVLKKTIKNFKPQIGYLRARGPGVVRASHLRLPPFIQCVDPDQYIATLADNGFLNLKFIIQYGNKWLSPQNSLSGVYNQRTDNKESEKINSAYTPLGGPNTYNYNSAFNLHLKKRRLILKKLKHISTPVGGGAGALRNKNSYYHIFAQSTLFLSKYAKKIRAYSPYLSSGPLINPLFCFSKKGGIRGWGVMKKGLSVDIPISKKYPAINLKNGLFKKLSKSISPPLIKIKGGSKLSRGGGADYLGKINKAKINKGGVPKDQAILESSGSKLLFTPGVNKSAKKTIFLNANPLTIDAVFNPINKVNYIIEINDFKTAPSKMQTSFETSELYEMLKSTKFANDFLSTDAVYVPTPTPSPGPGPGPAPSGYGVGVGVGVGVGAGAGQKDLKNYMQNQFRSEQQISSSLNQSAPSGYKRSATRRGAGIAQAELDNILEIKREINALKKDAIKHNITLEVWTNGSIHPRDALYQGFKNLIKLFAKLKKINTFGVNQLPSSPLPLGTPLHTFASPPTPLPPNKGGRGGGQGGAGIPRRGWGRGRKIKDLLPLNETSFLSTYVAPKLKNYYLNNESLSEVLKKPVLKRQPETFFIPSTTLRENDVLSTENENKELTPENPENKGRGRDKFSEAYPGPGPAPSGYGVGVGVGVGVGANKKNILARKADIGILNLSLRSYTSLKRLQINTIEELLALSKKDLADLKRLGKPSFEEIEKNLEKIGFDLFYFGGAKIKEEADFS